MTTEISTTPVTTDFSKANVLTFQDKVVLNDPSNFPENTDNFFGTIIYDTVESNIGKYTENAKSQWDLSTNAITLTYINN